MRAPKTDTEHRQGQIAEAALDLIGTAGVHALSISGIAERVGIVPSGVYKHYRSKDDVLDAVLDLLRERMMNNVAAVREQETHPMARMRLLLKKHIRMLAENRAIPHVIFSDGIYTGHGERKERVRDIIAGYLNEIQTIIREGQREGSIGSDVIPLTASLMFLGMVLPAAVLWSVSDGDFDVAAHEQNAWPAFERALAADV